MDMNRFDEIAKTLGSAVSRRAALQRAVGLAGGSLLGLFGFGKSALAQSCLPGRTNCAGTCVNLATDPKNCGICGKVCAAGSTCVAGACVQQPVTCPPGRVNCAGTCVNLATDPKNCGICGKVCPAGSTCVAGACVQQPVTCPPGQVNCAGTCVNLATDPKNCGMCGKVCAAGSTCVAGACVGKTSAAAAQSAYDNAKNRHNAAKTALDQAALDLTAATNTCRQTPGCVVR